MVTKHILKTTQHRHTTAQCIVPITTTHYDKHRPPQLFSGQFSNEMPNTLPAIRMGHQWADKCAGQRMFCYPFAGRMMDILVDLCGISRPERHSPFCKRNERTSTVQVVKQQPLKGEDGAATVQRIGDFEVGTTV